MKREQSDTEIQKSFNQVLFTQQKKLEVDNLLLAPDKPSDLGLECFLNLIYKKYANSLTNKAS